MVAPYTRFGLEGYGVRRAGSFAGKAAGGGGGPHPVGKITRFGLEGYGVRRAGDFSGKSSGGGGGPHPVGILTRFGLEGYGVRRAGIFLGKRTSSVTPPPPPPVVSLAEGAGSRPYSSPYFDPRTLKALKRRRQLQLQQDEEDAIIALLLDL